MAASWIWLNGTLVRGDVAHLTVGDRGFQLGDGVFETLAVHRGVAIQLPEHLARLRASGAAMDLDVPYPDEVLAAAVALVTPGAPARHPGGEGADPVPDTAVRITVSRGPTPGRGLLPPPGIAPTVAVQAWPTREPTELVRRGVRAVLSPIRRDPRSPLAGVKTTSRADHVWARLDAARRGADDALFLTADGAVAESTQANVWVARGTHLLTPPLAAGILAGTTRSWLLAWADHLGLEAVEATLQPEDLFTADEAFLSSSVAGILPLTVVEGRPIGDGRPGPVALAVREARRSWIRSQGTGRPGETEG